MESLVRALLWILGGYLALGLVLAIPLVTRGVGQFDANARGTGLGFRLMILPGTAALWPVLMLRWWRAQHTPLGDGPRPQGAEA